MHLKQLILLLLPFFVFYFLPLENTNTIIMVARACWLFTGLHGQAFPWNKTEGSRGRDSVFKFHQQLSFPCSLSLRKQTPISSYFLLGIENLLGFWGRFKGQNVKKGLQSEGKRKDFCDDARDRLREVEISPISILQADKLRLAVRSCSTSPGKSDSIPEV